MTTEQQFDDGWAKVMHDEDAAVKWHRVAADIATNSPLKFGWIEDGRFIDRIGNIILVEFPSSLQDMTETMFWPQALAKIEQLLTEALKAEISVKCLFRGGDRGVREEYDVKIGGEEVPFDNILSCPICGCQWTHLEVTEYISGEDDYKAHPNVRGDVIKIWGWCEDGCGFDVFLGQHKGFTHVWAQKSPNKKIHD